MAKTRPKASKKAGKKFRPKIGWTPEREAHFLDIVAQTASVAQALKIAHCSRTDVYRRAANDPEFGKKFTDAKRAGAHLFEDTCIQQALEGTNEPVFHNGAQIVDAKGRPIFIKNIPWVFRIFYLKRMFPEYRDRYEFSGPGGGPLMTGSTVQIYIPDNGRAGQTGTEVAAPVATTEQSNGASKVT